MQQQYLGAWPGLPIGEMQTIKCKVYSVHVCVLIANVALGSNTSDIVSFSY